MIKTSGIIWMECGHADPLYWSYYSYLPVDEYLLQNAYMVWAYSKNPIDIPGVFIANFEHISQLPVKFLLLTLNFENLVVQGKCLFSKHTWYDMI